MTCFYLGLLAVWQILLTGLELCRQKQGKCMRRAEFQELAQAVSFCGYKGTANAVCHLAATSLSSTLQAYSCATNWQAQSLLFKAQSVPWDCTAPDLRAPFQTHVQTLEILPLLPTTLPAQADFLHLWYMMPASPDQGICPSTYISAPQSV